MVKSGLRITNVEVGERLWHCPHWLDASADFVEVEVTEKGRGRLKLAILGGPEQGQNASAYASAVWRGEQLGAAREYRKRDLAIKSLDQERPLDTVTQTAIEMCCVLLTDDTDFEDESVTRGLLRRLGHEDDLKELHELAYAEPDAAWPAVRAPADAWRSLYQAFAAAEPQVIDDRVDEASESLSYIPARTRGQAMAMLRRWAGLPPARPVAPDADTPQDEVSRLRAIVELATDALDEAGRGDRALQLRRAAFPHRFPHLPGATNAD